MRIALLVSIVVAVSGCSSPDDSSLEPHAESATNAADPGGDDSAVTSPRSSKADSSTSAQSDADSDAHHEDDADAGSLAIDAGPRSPEQICVDTINQYRATLHLAPYARWNAEETCADGQATTDAMKNVPHSAFATCGEHGQNECPGWPGAPSQMITGCLAQMWAEGPGSDFATHGHYLNMTSTSFTRVSCGFHVQADGRVWATQDFE